MIIAGAYSFNNGREIIEAKYAVELQDVEQAIAAVNSKKYKTKTSREKTIPGKRLYHPDSLNRAFEREFKKRNWQTHNLL